MACLWFALVVFFASSFANCKTQTEEKERIYLPPPKGVSDVLPNSEQAQNSFPTTRPQTRQAPATSFICVVEGTCNCLVPGCDDDNGDIDIRIVSPTAVCPPGQVPCYGYQCGASAVPVKEGDGFSNNGSFPWQAYFENATGFAGSGVLIDPWHVVTAAHKVAYLSCCPGPNNFVVYMGIWNPMDRSRAQASLVAAIVIHEGYNPRTLANDIAIIRLVTPVIFGPPNVNIICMPPQGAAIAAGTRCMVSGWGQTNFNVNDAPTVPQKQVTVPIIGLADCRNALAQVINNVDLYLSGTNVCAGTITMRDACTQDGGSPLVCMNPQTKTQFVYGLVIWGKGCGKGGVPGVYVGIPSYVNWIQATVNQLNAAAAAG